MSTTEVAPATGRSAALAASRQAKLDGLFLGKLYTILKEVHLPPGKVFQTPLGHKGANGYALQLIDAEGQPITVSTDGQPVRFMVGATLLKLVAESYGSVQVPEKVRKRRTSEQKASDEARAVTEREHARIERAQHRAEAAGIRAMANEKRMADKNARAAAKAAKAAAFGEIVDPVG